MKSTSDGRRKSRVEKEVQSAISQFIIQQMKSDIPGLVTVTRVQMPSDFRGAQVFVTYYDVTADPKAKPFDVVKVLQYWAGDIQDELTHQLQLRYCPKIKFFYDETLSEALKIETILANLATPASNSEKNNSEETD
jgi:ribosome-binding factor A